MKFDKETIVVLLVAGAILLGWVLIFPKWQTQKTLERERIENEIASTREKYAIKPKNTTTPASIPTPQNPPIQSDTHETLSTEKNVQPVVKSFEDQNIVISNSFIEATVNTLTGAVREVKLKEFMTADKSANVMIGVKAPRNTFAMDEFPNFTLSALDFEKSDDGRLSINRTYISSGGVEFTLAQIYELKPDSYQLACRFEFRNNSQNPIVLPDLVIWTTGVPPLKHLAGDKAYTDRHNVEYCLSANNIVVSIDSAAKEEKYNRVTEQPVTWTGSANKYFAALLFPSEPFNGGIKLTREYHAIHGSKDNYSYPAIAGIYRKLIVPEESVKALDFLYYCGPKEIRLIKELPESAMQVMHLSYFSWMDYLARPLLWLLNKLKMMSGSYGWAIILLTLIVRIIFWPITQKANNSMRKMQKIQPMVAELREKYKDNPQEMNTRMMEIYRKEKVNPLGGCLPILLQLPVFFALYSALDSAVELRQVAFWWIGDLSKPDLIGPQIPLPFLGLVGLHPLVIAMSLLMLLQQKMTPSAADPMQQRIMMTMPIVMLFMLYNLPSGLTLYWTVSQIFSILQLKYSQYIAKKEEERENNNTNPPSNKKKTA